MHCVHRQRKRCKRRHCWHVSRMNGRSTCRQKRESRWCGDVWCRCMAGMTEGTLLGNKLVSSVSAGLRLRVVRSNLAERVPAFDTVLHDRLLAQSQRGKAQPENAVSLARGEDERRGEERARAVPSLRLDVFEVHPSAPDQVRSFLSSDSVFASAFFSLFSFLTSLNFATLPFQFQVWTLLPA